MKAATPKIWWVLVPVVALAGLAAVWLTGRSAHPLAQRASFRLPESQADALAFQADGRTLVVAAGAPWSTLVALDTADGTVRSRFNVPDVARLRAYSSDGRSYGAGRMPLTLPGASPNLPAEDATIHDVADGHMLLRLRGLADLYDYEFAPDGQTVVTLQMLPRTPTAAELDEDDPDPEQAPATVELCVRAWDVASGQERASVTVPLPMPTRDIAFSADRRAFAIVDAEHSSVVVREVASGRVVQTLRPEPGVPRWPLHLPRFSHDGSMLSAARDDGSLVIWNLRDARVMATLLEGQRFRASVGAMEFTPDGRSLVAAYVETGRLRTAGLGLPFGLDRWLFGRTAGLPGRSLVVWDVRARRRRARLDGQDAEVNTFAISPDGRTLATARAGGPGGSTVHLWTLP